MKHKAIIVEFKEDAEYFLQREDVRSGKIKMLSLLPEASAYLAQHNVPYENTLDYLPRASHEACLKTIDRAICRIGDSVVLKDAEGVSRAYVNALTFYLRCYVSALVLTVEVIMNYLRVHGITEVEVCRYRPVYGGQWVLSSHERILSSLVGLVAQAVPLTATAHSVSQKIPRHYGGQWVKAFYQAVCHKIAIGAKTHGPSAFFYGLKFNFDRLSADIGVSDIYNLVPEKNRRFQVTQRRNGIRIHDLHLDCLTGWCDHVFAQTMDRMIQSIAELHQKDKLFVHRGVDVSSLVLAKLKSDIADELRSVNRQTRSLIRSLKAIRPSIVVSPMARGFSHALGEASRLLNIPSVLISHGSHVPPPDEFSRMEWFDHGKGLIDTEYQYHLLQSPWAVRYAESFGLKKGYFKVMPIIFPKVDRTKKLEKQLAMYPQSRGKKIIVHAGTPKARGSNRMYIYETLDEYVQNIADLIEVAKNMPDVFLIVRFRPLDYLCTKDLKKLLPAGDHYVVATEGSFNDYLTIADLMVSFSSTTIEEALHNRIPVLQYDRTGRYQHIEGASCVAGCFAQKDSVYFIADHGVLGQGLRWIIEQHLSQPADDRLFERHMFDPQRTITAAEFIRQVMAGTVKEQEEPRQVLAGSKKG